METSTNKYSRAILMHMAFESRAFQSSVCASEKKHSLMQFPPDAIIPHPAFLRS